MQSRDNGLSIPLHPEHGVNPAVYSCYLCGEDIGLILPGAKTKGFKEAGLCDSDGKMHRNVGCLDKEPCDKCKGYMKIGIIVISVRDGESGDNPYRTGGWCVVKEDMFKRMLADDEDPTILNSILKSRVCFLEDKVWDSIGFPRTGGEDNE